MKKNNVAVIGLGYVGLPLAALSAIKGYKTIGFDINNNLTSNLSNGKIHIRDNYVQKIFKKAVESKNFLPTSNHDDLADSDIYLVCVPTPITNAKEPDLGPLIGAIKVISPYINKGDLVVIESTVFPGTCENIVAYLITELTGFDCYSEISLAHCPERINPGDAFWTSGNIPRVLGSLNLSGTKQAANFYSSLLGGPVIDIDDVKSFSNPKFLLDSFGDLKINSLPIGSVTVMRSIRDAEAVKVMENTVRDVNIALVNELAKISDVLNLNVVDVIQGMSTKPFGKGPYYPGVGVGGHCIAVDPEWLKTASIRAGYIPEILELSRKTNREMPEYTVNLLEENLAKCGFVLKGTKIAVLGVSYKRNVNDLRESPFFDIKKILLDRDVELAVYDSWIRSENTSNTLFEVIKNCVAIIIVTDHSDMIKELLNLSLDELGVRVIIDGRNSINPKYIPNKLIYKGIGR